MWNWNLRGFLLPLRKSNHYGHLHPNQIRLHRPAVGRALLPGHRLAAVHALDSIRVADIGYRGVGAAI